MIGVKLGLQTKIISVWSAAAAAICICAILSASHPVLGPASLIALMALVFPGIPIAALAMTRGNRSGSRRT